MQRVIQSAYALFLNNVYKVTSKISEEKREKIIFTVVTFYSCFIMFCRADNITKTVVNDYRAGIVFCISIFLVTLFSVDRQLKYISCRSLIPKIYYALFLLMLLVSCFHEVGTGHRIYILASLVLLPMLYYVWGNRQDYDVLYRLVAKGFCYSGLSYFAATWLFFPMDFYTSSAGAYLGATHNPNVLGAIGLGMAIAALYLYMTEESKFVPILTIASGVNLIIMGQSRTAFLSFFCPFIVLFIIIIYMAFIKKELPCKNKVRLLVVCAIFVVISVPIIESMFSYINTAFADSEGLIDKFKRGTSSGRIELWKYCLSDLHLFGNDVGAYILFENFNYAGVHNSVIEMAYRYGIIAGMLYIVLGIACVVYCLRILFKEKWKDSLFICLIICSFLVYLMLEVAFLPYKVGVAYMSVFALTGLFNYEVKKSKH